MEPHFPDHVTEQDRFLTDSEVVALTTLSKTTLWRMRRAGEFPAKVRLSRGRAATNLRAVREWMHARLQLASSSK